MKIQPLIAHQFDLVYRMIADNVEGMTAEQSLAQPSPGGNCANWILGHLTNVQNDVMRLAGQEPVWASDQLSNAGWDPITSQAKAIPWEIMRGRILDSRERCVAAISNLSDQKMADEVPHPFGGTSSRGQLLGTLSFYQAYHAGQFGIARRIAGLEGAVKGPGQPRGTAVAHR